MSRNLLKAVEAGILEAPAKVVYYFKREPFGHTYRVDSLVRYCASPRASEKFGG
jgi:hypothetical protein